MNGSYDNIIILLGLKIKTAWHEQNAFKCSTNTIFSVLIQVSRKLFETIFVFVTFPEAIGEQQQQQRNVNGLIVIYSRVGTYARIHRWLVFNINNIGGGTSNSFAPYTHNWKFAN